MRTGSGVAVRNPDSFQDLGVRARLRVAFLATLKGVILLQDD